jgi:hypothetical protein
MKHEIRLLEDDNYDLDDTVAPEYDIEAIRKQAKLEGREYRGIFSGKGVRLAPDVAEVFDSSEAVNEALRTVIRVMRNAESKAA